ncbi:cellulase family glycosylhydrolase [uncultured Cellulomonas sp.]|uniref:cellulase family glycosylhydrolase n=1 Tax=uncultured Cellulomonas sp. TaxID=189682 RepID=UPI00262A547B|nr:cellulase family glycosylhydrolase [uncultured Cellulomonas sp.]
MSPRSRLTVTALALATALTTLVPSGAAAAAPDLLLSQGHAASSARDRAPAAEQFVERSGGRLTLDRRTFRFAGTNQYYLMYADPVMTDAVLEKAAANDFDVLRAWAFFDIGQSDGTGTIADGDKGVYFHYWDPATGAPAYNDGPSGLEKLDYMVAKAKEEGVRLVLPLTNNWANFGGMDQYNQWAGSQFHSDFYTDPQIRTWYKDWVSHLLNRVNTVTGVAYKDEPAIMAWELANEPRCGGSGLFPRDPGCTSDTLTAWVAEMSTHIKSIDQNHLVGTGDEGFLCDQPASDDFTRNCADGVDSARFAALDTIDYLSYHLYPDHWGRDAAWGTQWIELHNKVARNIRKPAVLGEFGWHDEATRNVVYREWTQAFERTGGTGALYWLLSDVQADGTLYPDYDGFTVYCPSPVCTLLSNFAETMRTREHRFAPVADDDAVVTDFGMATSVDLVANDVAYQADVRPATLDLNPATGGRQTTFDTSAGSFVVDGAGVLTFTPADGFAGRAVAAYTIEDVRRRTSEVATVTVTVKPSPQAAQVLFDFSDDAQGWAGAGAATAVAGQLAVDSTNGWFGATLTAPVDMSARTQLRLDLVSTTGVGPILALQVGDAFTWCQAAPLSYGSDPRTGDDAVTFDLTTLDEACTAGLADVRAVNVFFNAGQHVVDNIAVR